MGLPGCFLNPGYGIVMKVRLFDLAILGRDLSQHSDAGSKHRSTLKLRAGAFGARGLRTPNAFASKGARFTTPVLKNGLLFGYHNRFFCVDAKTGTTLWTDTASRGNSVNTRSRFCASFSTGGFA